MMQVIDRTKEELARLPIEAIAQLLHEDGYGYDLCLATRIKKAAHSGSVRWTEGGILISYENRHEYRPNFSPGRFTRP